MKIPCSYCKAMENPDNWLPVMEAKIEGLRLYCIWTLVDPPLNCHLLDKMWVFDLKLDREGIVVKRRYAVGRNRL